MKYDYVIFGASGFTGQFVVEFMANALKRDNDESSTWAISGRNEGKLRTVLANASKATELDLSKVPIIICDTGDSKSVLDMANKAKVVLNCVGPYRFFGEQVVAACVEAGANHVDISGEPQYLEKMQLKYNEEAKAKGIYIVGACGFDSVPADVGQTVVHREMGGDVNSIETFLTVTAPDDLPGPTINFATFQSAIHGFANAGELKGLRKQIYPERLPQTSPKLRPRGSLFWNEELNKYCMPFPGSDRSVMMRTQRSRFHVDTERPAQVHCYFTISGLFSAFMIMLGGLMFGTLAKFKFGRSLLEDYPRFFSFGAVSKDGPSKEMAEGTNFEMTLLGRGWREEGKTEGKPDREVRVKVSGKNVGYGATCECLVQAAMVILKERERLPGSGGVITPGYAFAKTSLVDRLTSAGVPFVASTRDL